MLNAKILYTIAYSILHLNKMPSLLKIGLVIIKQYRNFAVLSAYKNCARFLYKNIDSQDCLDVYVLISFLLKTLKCFS